MKNLLAPTDQFIKIGFAVLDEDVLAGSNVTLKLINNTGAALNAYTVIGWEGNELAELQQVNDTVYPGTDIRVETLKFNHKKGEPVTIYRYNQRKFYGSVTEGGPYYALTSYGSPKAISVDNPQGTQIEYNGTEGYLYFKATYYNSTTTEETDQSDATSASGSDTQRYATLYAIRKHAGLVGNGAYSDLRLEVKRTQAESEINSSLANKYILPLTEVPAILGNICELLAAGYIDFEEFGENGEGVKWLGEARGLLKNLREGTQVLIGMDGHELATNGNLQSIQSFPSSKDEAPAKFGMAKKF